MDVGQPWIEAAEEGEGELGVMKAMMPCSSTPRVVVCWIEREVLVAQWMKVP